MSICLEYLTRTGLVEDLTTFPCSFFLTDRFNGRRIVICVNKPESVYSVKRWDLDLCSVEHALPPMEEYTVYEIHDPKIIVPSTEILRFKESPIPSRENTVRRPMEKYDLYFDNFLTFEGHNKYKEKWLWESFLSIYYPDLLSLGLVIKRTINMYGDYASPEIMDNQKAILEFQKPKFWKYWEMWLKYMLDFKGIPGEFVFSHYFNTGLD